LRKEVEFYEVERDQRFSITRTGTMWNQQ